MPMPRGVLTVASIAAVLLLASCQSHESESALGGNIDTSDGHSDRTEQAGVSTAGATMETNTADEPPASEPITRYVALGDSYAAMSSASAVGQAPEAQFCSRSADNYAGQLASYLKELSPDSPMTFTDVSCQGGVTADILQPRNTPNGALPAQADALTPETQLVTLTIGGNDINFGALAYCAGMGSNCAAQNAAATDAAFEELPARLDAVYEAIAQRAPKARIITTGYLPLIAEGDTCDFASRLGTEDTTWFAGTTARINEVVREAAERHGAMFVMPQPHDGQGHTACADMSQRWTSIDGQGTDSFPMHPTPAGQTAMFQAIRSTLAG